MQYCYLDACSFYHDAYVHMGEIIAIDMSRSTDKYDMK